MIKVGISLLVFVLIIVSCGEGNKSKSSEGNAGNDSSRTKTEINADSTFDEFAKIICGNSKKLPTNIDAIYYDSFSKQLNLKLEEINKSRLTPITKWNDDALNRNKKSDTNSVFYPFSGGDFLHVNSLYPNANHYVMMAQESVGSIPDLSKMDKIQTKQYIRSVDNILRDIYAKSYFITMNMIKDINSTPVNGMLPVLLWSVSKTGHTITKVEELTVDETGKRTFSPFKVGENKAKAVRITFGNSDVGIEKTLTYYSCDISDSGIEKDKALQATLKSIPPSNCFVKSASYLMHYETFTKIRNTILDKAIYLVQDDTGIPYKYFEKNKFNLELYGTYIKPVSDFSDNLFQKDMAEAYKSSEYKSQLSFSLGYHWQTKDQNQMIAIKK
jgi:hypothetical protein